jgi:hypothetical protein
MSGDDNQQEGMSVERDNSGPVVVHRFISGRMRAPLRSSGPVHMKIFPEHENEAPGGMTPVRTRTADLYVVKGQLTKTLNNLDPEQGWLNVPKYA